MNNYQYYSNKEKPENYISYSIVDDTVDIILTKYRPYWEEMYDGLNEFLKSIGINDVSASNNPVETVELSFCNTCIFKIEKYFIAVASNGRVTGYSNKTPIPELIRLFKYIEKSDFIPEV